MKRVAILFEKRVVMPSILIVDDEIDFLTYLDDVLTRLGYETAGMAITGESAVETARLLRPDLLLMDIDIPGPMGGIETAKIIRDEMPAPVIFLLPRYEKNWVERAKPVYPAACLIKPVEEDQLEIAIELALNDSRLSASVNISDHEPIFDPEKNRDKRLLEKQMRKMIRAEAIRTLSASISHQYNNDITAINGYAQLIDIKYPDSPDLVSYSKIIQQAGKRISTIFSQLSVLSQQEEKQFQPESVCELIQKVIPVIQETSLTQVSWETELDPAAYPIAADAESLRLALYSLLKYLTGASTGEARTVQVICQNLSLHELSTETPENIQLNHYVYLKIQDDGFILEDEHKKWTPNSFTVPSFSERNMNLFAAYHIIQKHGGNLTLESENDKGTSVQVYFPAICPPDA